MIPNAGTKCLPGLASRPYGDLAPYQARLDPQCFTLKAIWVCMASWLMGFEAYNKMIDIHVKKIFIT